MTQRIFAISTLLLVLVIGAIFVYNFIFKKPSGPESSSTAAKTADEGKLKQNSGLQTDTQGKSGSSAPGQTAAQTADIQPISDEAVFGATLSADGKSILYFLGGNGQLNQVDLSGKLTKVLSTEQFDNLKKVIWNSQKNRAIIATDNGNGSQRFYFLDISQKKTTPLKDNLDSVAWSNQGDKIIYKYYDSKTKKRTVSIADPDGKNWKDLTEFDYHDVSISTIPGSSQISFWPSPNAFTEISLNTIGFGGAGKKEILKGRFGTDILWSPDGKQAVASCSDAKGGHKIDLFIMNSQGGQFQSLQMATFASKCAWTADSKNVICATPGNIPDSAILPNDWQEGKVQAADTFWKIDTVSGKKDRLIDPEKIGGSFDAIGLFLSQDEKTLFFVSKSDGKLYKLGL